MSRCARLLGLGERQREPRVPILRRAFASLAGPDARAIGTS